MKIFAKIKLLNGFIEIESENSRTFFKVLKNLSETF